MSRAGDVKRTIAIGAPFGTRRRKSGDQVSCTGTRWARRGACLPRGIFPGLVPSSPSQDCESKGLLEIQGRPLEEALWTSLLSLSPASLKKRKNRAAQGGLQRRRLLLA